MTTQIYANKQSFDKRKNKAHNGVSRAFANKHADWKTTNATNEGCWNCHGSIDCDYGVGLIDCRSCFACIDCVRCTDSFNCQRCEDCTDCEDCKDKIGQKNRSCGRT